MRKKILITILVVISLFACITVTTPLGVKADSGFDSSYDSGGSDWGSSSDSWSSSSDWSSSSGSYSTREMTAEEAAAFLIVFLIMFIVIFIISFRTAKKANTGFMLDHSKEISDEEYRKYFSEDKRSFSEARFNDYLKVQEDWMNFNYDGLRENLTDELYNQYSMQLDTLKMKNQRNVMDNFRYIDSMITSIYKENNQITVNMELMVSFVDYIEENGNVVRGNKFSLITQHYALTFVMTEGNDLDNCPNCGAPLNDNASQKCEYCGSVITKGSKKCVLSKKESLRQR